ncbi:hypothetical protein [Sandarakinorhabdus sp.]|uniref:hypothetical protein n=1 Tax=Sandarakinorhabdus sp. TaxID=1916663 RepID=UPI0035692F0C
MNPWALLGLKPSADRADIRRAYARLLKITNPEDDPEGFMALRAAHDAALNQLQWRQQGRDDEADDGGAPALAELEAALASPVLESVLAEDSQFAAERGDLLARQEALIAAIQAGPGGQRAAFDALMAAPAMDGVATRANIENWLAGLIANSLPASDSLVVAAIARFGWEDLPRGRIPPAIAALLQRREEGEFVARIALPHTDLHVGYSALSQPPGPRWWRHVTAMVSAAPAQTRSILGLVDGPLPGIADWLNSDAAAAWRDWHSVVRMRLWMIFTMFPLAAVVLAGLLSLSGWPQALQQGAGLLALAVAGAAPLGLLAVLRARQRHDWDRPDWQYSHWPLAVAACNGDRTMTGSRPFSLAPAAQMPAPLLGPLVLFTLALAFAGQILLIALQLAVPWLASAGPPQLLDFQVFHIAGQLALAGDLATAYDPVQFWAHTRALTGSPDRMLWPGRMHFSSVRWWRGGPVSPLPAARWRACRWAC